MPLCRRCSRRAQGYYCGFPTGKASPPDACTKPYNPWLGSSRRPDGDGTPSAERLPAYGCHLHHAARAQNIAHYGVKDSWVDFSQWHDAQDDSDDSDDDDHDDDDDDE